MLDTTLTTARILIVDDQPSNVLLLEGILQEVYSNLQEKTLQIIQPFGQNSDWTHA